MTGRPLPALIDHAEGDPSDAGVELLNPQTGEQLSLTSATPRDLGEFIDAVREWEAMAKVAKGVVSAELHRRMDADACWTINAGDFDLVGASPNRVEYDVGELRAALKGLVDDELISLDAAKKAVKREVTFKPVVSGINALLKLGGEVKERLEAVAQPIDKGSRRISIKGKS